MADFPIAGIGSSAGGLEALEKLFGAMPPDSGLGFVVVAHLDPTQESHLSELLSRDTKMPVLEVGERIEVEPNRVYVVAPDRYLTIKGGMLHPSKPSEPRGQRRAVDVFLRSLAEDQGGRAIGIVLSGTGTDGAQGLRAIKAEGGMTLAQDPATAGFDGMPQSAITTGGADLVLPPEKMAEALLDLVRHPYLRRPAEVGPPTTVDGHLAAVLSLVRAGTKQDFRCYKRSTLFRRIHRRMGLHQIVGLDHYVDRLRNDPDELAALARDLTINVSGFFRDPEAWKVLDQKVIAPLVEKRPADASIRVWVPGCATGEEAYSIAMLLVERAAAVQKSFDLKIFATDVSEHVLPVARAGLYPASIAQEISRERLERFFDREDDSYRIKGELRDAITLAPQNLMQDPPFSRLDVITCRNLLIYLEPEIQKKLLGLFHFALREGGHLFLGPAETASAQGSLFQPISKKWRICLRLGPTRHDVTRFPLLRPSQDPDEAASAPAALPAEPRARPSTLFERALLEQYVPAAVLIDHRFNVLEFHGPTGDYLQQPGGEPTTNLLALAREGLQAPLRAAVQKAIHDDQEVTVDARVRRGRSWHPVRLVVRPLRPAPVADGMLAVSFLEREPVPQGNPAPAVAERLPQNQLEAELTAAREELRLFVEQTESANAELQASNEEIRSMNEELQASNEELETSKEELQSLNEELLTVNSQLQVKLRELETRTNDLNNLLNSTEVATLFLDADLCIRWFTPAMKGLLDLMPADIGRPISHFAQRFLGGDLAEDAKEVLRRLVPRMSEVAAGGSDRTYIRNVLPYRTEDNRIDGVVITFTEITERKHWEQQIEAARHYAESIVATVREPLLVLTPDLKVRSANSSFYRTYHVKPEETLDRPIYELGNRQWDIPQLRRLLDEVLPTDKQFEDFEVEHDFEDIGHRVMLLNARRLDDSQLILLAIADVTERRYAELAVLESQRHAQNQLMELETLYRTAPVGLAVLDRDLRYQRINHVLAEINGLALEAHLGRTCNEVVPEIFETLDPVLRRVLATGEAATDVEVSGVTSARPGEIRHWLTDYYPLKDESGTSAVGVVVREITDRKRMEHALREHEHRLAMAIEAIGGGVYDHAVPIGPELYLSERWAGILGYQKEELPAHDGFLDWLFAQVHPDDRDALDIAYSGFIEGRTPKYEVESRTRHKNGQWVWVRGFAHAIARDVDGRVTRAIGVMINITEQKQAEEERELLAQELSHRVKNVLAVVQALAMQTKSSGSLEEYRDSFVGRLSALARAHSLLLDAQWLSADLKELVRLALQAYRVDHPDVVEIEGDSVALRANQGLGLSLILHELGTNAAKYGALSCQDGRVHVSWWVDGHDSGRRVHLLWQERHGPAVEPPRERGFGLQLIERACAYELEGEVELDYAPGGLRCEVLFPLT